jgi:hypothetical protein
LRSLLLLTWSESVSAYCPFSRAENLLSTKTPKKIPIQTTGDRRDHAQPSIRTPMTSAPSIRPHKMLRRPMSRPFRAVEPTLATGADATSARLPPSSKCCVEDLAIQAAPLVFTLPRGVGLSFSQAFLAIALERRQPIFDDATPTGRDLNRHRHVGSEVEQLPLTRIRVRLSDTRAA